MLTGDDQRPNLERATISELLAELEVRVARPNLGLASTSELLAEVSTRMRVTQNSLAGRELGRWCEDALEHLDAGVLAYRTATSR